MEAWNQIVAELRAWFIYPNVTALQMLVAVGLAVAFGALWLAAHWPPLFKRPWLWAVGVVSAFLTMAAFAFVNAPLQHYYGRLVNHFLNSASVSDWLLLLVIPAVIINGLVQEAAKLVPMVLFWAKEDFRITPAMGLALGAAAGVGFGVFDGFQAFGAQFSNGWTTAAFSQGFLGIAGYWIRFFSLGFQAAASAMVGYGLARGKGWQYLLVAAGFHALFLYGGTFYNKQYFTEVQLGVYVAFIAVVLSAIVLIVRYRLHRDYPDEAAYDPVLFLEHEEKYAAEVASATAENAGTAGTASPLEEPPAADTTEKKPD